MIKSPSVAQFVVLCDFLITSKFLILWYIRLGLESTFKSKRQIRRSEFNIITYIIFLTFSWFACHRCMVSETNILQMKDIITACKNSMCAQTGELEENQLILCLRASAEAFRFLRNCCAATPKNQNSIV